MKKTQIEFIKSELLAKGEISRNHCLRNYISRLSARILDLEKDGWVFTTEKREGDFVYKVAHIPVWARPEVHEAFDKAGKNLIMKAGLSGQLSLI